MDQTEFVARALGVHFVAVTCRRRPADPSQPETRPVISGFLADIDGHWFYVTAGHVLRDVDAAMRQGVTFDHWQFDDQTAGHRFAFTHNPFAFERTEWLDIYDLGMDYAALPLRDLYRDQLKAGGAQPLPEHTWSDHGVYHEHWFLLGIPRESVKMRTDGNLSARTVGIALSARSDVRAQAHHVDEVLVELVAAPDQLVLGRQGRVDLHRLVRVERWLPLWLSG